MNVPAQNGPLLIPDDHERDSPVFQILLVTHVFVSGYQNLETSRFRSGYEFAVPKPVPSAFNRFHDHVILKGMAKWRRGTVIEEYEHRPLERRAV